jgi:hypothetical protein
MIFTLYLQAVQENSREYLGSEVPLTVLIVRGKPRFAALIIPLGFSANLDNLFEVLFLPPVKNMKNKLW